MNQDRTLSTDEARPTGDMPPPGGDVPPPGGDVRPWGFWATLGWTLLAFGLGFGLMIAAYISMYSGQGDKAPELLDDPWFPLHLIVSNVAQILVLAAAARWAKWPPAQYLGLGIPRTRDIRNGLAAVIVLLLALEILTHLIGRDSVTPFQTDTYRVARATGTLPLMWLAFVIVAPLGEEIVFRGFVFRGWAASWLGVPGTIVLTSLIFAAAHTQYDWFGTFQTFCMGALFATLRWRSGSTTLTIILHMMINLVATAWAALKVTGVV